MTNRPSCSLSLWERVLAGGRVSPACAKSPSPLPSPEGRGGKNPDSSSNASYHEGFMKRLWLIVLLVWSMVPSESLAQGWSDVVDPAPGSPRSVGTYTAGCVQGAIA